MARKFRAALWTVVFTVVAVGVVHAQVVTKVGGLAFADYYAAIQNHKEDVEGRNAFEFRRLYFTVDNELTKDIKTRFRIEAKQGDFGSGSKLTPFIKNAYIEWNNLIPRHQLILGISGSNAIKNSETYWGYRSIEKTIMDLNKISPSADMGIALTGDLSDVFHHWVTIMNGPGYGSSEVDNFKRVGYAFWMTPVKGLIMEAYADYEKQDPDGAGYSDASDYAQASAYYTLKGFVGYDAPAYTIGVEGFLRTNRESGFKNPVTAADGAMTGYTLADVQRMGFSAFGSVIIPRTGLKLFGRYDYFDPNTSDDVFTAFSNGVSTGGVDDETRLIIAGLDVIPSANIHIMPNIIWKQYASGGKDADLTARVTLYYKFSSGKIIVE